MVPFSFHQVAFTSDTALQSSMALFLHWATLSWFSTHFHRQVFLEVQCWFFYHVHHFSGVFHLLRPHFSTLIGLQVHNNSISSNAIGVYSGVAVYVESSKNITMQDCSFTSNRIRNIVSDYVPTLPYVPPPETNATNHCFNASSITANSGTLTDGSIGSYSTCL